MPKKGTNRQPLLVSQTVRTTPSKSSTKKGSTKKGSTKKGLTKKHTQGRALPEITNSIQFAQKKISEENFYNKLHASRTPPTPYENELANGTLIPSVERPKKKNNISYRRRRSRSRSRSRSGS